MITTPNQSENKQTGTMVVVESKVNLEREIDLQVKKIHSLINKLTPTERQKYFNGLLAFILKGQVELTGTNQNKTTSTNDYSSLSENELELLSEMSDKMQELYHLIGDKE